MTAVVVPEEKPDQSELHLPRVQNPAALPLWWASQTATHVSENVMGWLVQQGWQIVGTSPDTTTVPPTIYYNLEKEVISPSVAILNLANNYTTEANLARFANEGRYNQVLTDWQEMIASSQTHFENQVTQQNAELGVYLGNLGTFMDGIETLADENLSDLKTDYGLHVDTTRTLLNDLGTTDAARIIEQFASNLATQLQGLTDRGLYSSAVAADITERNHRDRDEQLQQLYDRLAREKVGNEHQLHAQRIQLSEQKNQLIAQRLNTATSKLAGFRDVAAENQKLMAYQLDTRNQLIIGLYSFVERRDDIAPEWKDMANMISSLGSSWITS